MTKQFPVVYEWSGKNFSGFAPDVRGCVATGKTLAKMRASLKEALEGHLQWMLDDGDVMPEPSPAVTVDLAEDAEFPNPSGYYVVVERLSIEVSNLKSSEIQHSSKRELTAA